MGLIPGLLEWLVISPWISGSLTVPDGVAVCSAVCLVEVLHIFISCSKAANSWQGRARESTLSSCCFYFVSLSSCLSAHCNLERVGTARVIAARNEAHNSSLQSRALATGFRREKISV